MGTGIPEVLQSTTLSASSSSVVQVGTLPQIFNQRKALLPKCLCLIWLKVTIFSLGAVLIFCIISNGLTSRLLQIIFLLSRKT